jgi:hypothetical protein
MKLLGSNQLKDYQNKSVGIRDLNFYKKIQYKIENKIFSEIKLLKKIRSVCLRVRVFLIIK